MNGIRTLAVRMFTVAMMSLAMQAAAGTEAAVRPSLSFVENAMAGGGGTTYVARIPGATVLVAPDGARVGLSAPGEEPAVIALRFAGGSRSADLVPLEPLPGRVNIFHGNDPSAWRRNLPTFGEVLARGVYQGIDVRYHGAGAQLEYDLLVAPGADPAVIAMRFDGADSLSIAADGSLRIASCGRELVAHAPVLYQEFASGRRDVAGRFVLQGRDQVTFEVGAYDLSQQLVIDPVLSYSTFFGGAAFETGYSVVVDASGNAYVAGGTGSSDFPVTAAAWDTSPNGSNDAFVSKFDPTGETLLWSTYIGGSAGDSVSGLAVDAGGNVVLAGTTASPNFPVTPTAAQPTLAGGTGTDACVVKLDPSGSPILYSTYLGGTQTDEFLGAGIDSAGNLIAAGYTRSLDFPTTTTAYSRVFGGSTDACVVRVDLAGSGPSSLLYSTYLGGSGSEMAYDVAVDAAGGAVVAGETQSANFPTTSGAFDRILNGRDAFLARINPQVSGSASLTLGTFLGGRGNETASGVSVDSSDRAVVAGITYSVDFPTTTNAFSRALAGRGSGAVDAFVTLFNAGGSALAYSTYLGGGASGSGPQDDCANAVAADPVTGNLLVTGYAGSPQFPTTANAHDRTSNGSYDCFLSEINPSSLVGSASLVYSSYFGGAASDHGRGVAVGSAGAVFVTGMTQSTNVPTTTGCFDSSHNGSADGFLFKLTR